MVLRLPPAGSLGGDPAARRELCVLGGGGQRRIRGGSEACTGYPMSAAMRREQSGVSAASMCTVNETSLRAIP